MFSPDSQSNNIYGDGVLCVRLHCLLLIELTNWGESLRLSRYPWDICGIAEHLPLTFLSKREVVVILLTWKYTWIYLIYRFYSITKLLRWWFIFFLSSAIIWRITSTIYTAVILFFFLFFWWTISPQAISLAISIEKKKTNKKIHKDFPSNSIVRSSDYFFSTITNVFTNSW